MISGITSQYGSSDLLERGENNAYSPHDDFDRTFEDTLGRKKPARKVYYSSEFSSRESSTKENINKKDDTKKRGGRKKFSRVFSNPFMPSLLHLDKLAPINEEKQHLLGGVDGVATMNTERSQESIASSVISLRHTRMVPYNRNTLLTGPHGAKHESIQITKEDMFPVIPTNYMDPKGNFPMKDAYIDAIKSQFFGLGFSFGSSFQMFLLSTLIMSIANSNNAGPIRELSHEYYPVFRGIFLISYAFLLYGVCLFIWRRVKLDYASVLHVTYAHTYQLILRGSSSMAYIIFTCFMLFILTITGGLDELFINKSIIKHVWPAMAFFIPIGLFICPLDTWTIPFYGVRKNGFSQRWTLLQEIVKVLYTPFTASTFHRCLIADILCSMPKILPDLQYTLCIYLSGTFWESSTTQNEWMTDKHMHSYYTCGVGSPVYYCIQVVLGLLPFYFRLCQCLRAYYDTRHIRHLFNAFKYCLTLFLSTLSTFRNSFSSDTNVMLGDIWIVVGIIATIYSFTWDVCMDWGLGTWSAKNTLLRHDLYFKASTYYAVIAINFFMRLGWAFVISPQQPYIQQHFILLLGTIEITRRFIWCVLRVEWEYIRHKNVYSSSESLDSHASIATMLPHLTNRGSVQIMSALNTPLNRSPEISQKDITVDAISKLMEDSTKRTTKLSPLLRPPLVTSSPPLPPPHPLAPHTTPHRHGDSISKTSSQDYLIGTSHLSLSDGTGGGVSGKHPSSSSIMNMINTNPTSLSASGPISGVMNGMNNINGDNIFYCSSTANTTNATLSPTPTSRSNQYTSNHNNNISYQNTTNSYYQASASVTSSLNSPLRQSRNPYYTSPINETVTANKTGSNGSNGSSHSYDINLISLNNSDKTVTEILPLSSTNLRRLSLYDEAKYDAISSNTHTVYEDRPQYVNSAYVSSHTSSTHMSTPSPPESHQSPSTRHLTTTTTTTTTNVREYEDDQNRGTTIRNMSNYSDGSNGYSATTTNITESTSKKLFNESTPVHTKSFSLKDSRHIRSAMNTARTATKLPSNQNEYSISSGEQREQTKEDNNNDDDEENDDDDGGDHFVSHIEVCPTSFQLDDVYQSDQIRFFSTKTTEGISIHDIKHYGTGTPLSTPKYTLNESSSNILNTEPNTSRSTSESTPLSPNKSNTLSRFSFRLYGTNGSNNTKNE